MKTLNLLTAACAAVIALRATDALAGCTMDAECKGDRICVDSKCVSPASIAPAPVAAVPAAAPAPVVAPPPQATAPAVSVASSPAVVASPAVVTNAASSTPLANTVVAAQPQPGSTFLSQNGLWSVSFLGGVNDVMAGGQSLAVFQMDLHLEGGVRVNPDFSIVGFYDGGLPIIQGQVPLGLGTLGVGVGLGDKYRVAVGGGLAGALPIGNAIGGGLTLGGSLLAHGSVPLYAGFGLHAQFNVTFVGPLTLIQAGLGLGYQG